MAARILIVDDHPSFRASARALLEADGYEVVGEAEDGHSAVARRAGPAARHRPARRPAPRHRRLRGRLAPARPRLRRRRRAHLEPRGERLRPAPAAQRRARLRAQGRAERRGHRRPARRLTAPRRPPPPAAPLCSAAACLPTGPHPRGRDGRARADVRGASPGEADDRRRRRLPRPAGLRRAAAPPGARCGSTRSCCTTSTRTGSSGSARVLEGQAAEHGERLPFRATTDLDDAVEGADVRVLRRSASAGSRAAWSTRRCRSGSACSARRRPGPGGICFALRTIPVMVELAETIARARAAAPG